MPFVRLRCTRPRKDRSDEKRSTRRRDRLFRAHARGRLRIEQLQLQLDHGHCGHHIVEDSSSGGLKANTTPKYASPSSSSPIQSGVVPIAYRNIAIDPDTLKVKVGSTIKWTNYDSVEHNVTSEGGVAKFASKDFGEGGTYEVKVTKPGIIHYECTIHPATMNGTIEVVQ